MNSLKSFKRLALFSFSRIAVYSQAQQVPGLITAGLINIWRSPGTLKSLFDQRELQSDLTSKGTKIDCASHTICEGQVNPSNESLE